MPTSPSQPLTAPRSFAADDAATSWSSGTLCPPQAGELGLAEKLRRRARGLLRGSLLDGTQTSPRCLSSLPPYELRQGSETLSR